MKAATTPYPNDGQGGTRLAVLRRNLEAVAGPFPPGSGDAPAWEVLDSHEGAGYVRKSIVLEAEPGDRVPAFLFLPEASPTPGPAALCLHPTSPDGKKVVAGLAGLPNRQYASELAARGFVTLAPDYPNMGDYTVDPYALGYASTTMKAIVNHVRCVDLLASLPEVDGGRIGAIGHSLGGHNTLFLGVFDARVRALVTSCGFNAFHHYYGGDLTGWSHQGYMPRIAEVYGKDPDRMPFDFPELLAALAPRPLFVNAPLYDANFDVYGVQRCIAAALPAYRAHGARDRLVVRYPYAAHDFPDRERFEAYEFLARHLAP